MVGLNRKKVNNIWLVILILSIASTCYLLVPRHDAPDSNEVQNGSSDAENSLLVPYDQISSVEIINRGKRFRFDHDEKDIDQWYGADYHYESDGETEKDHHNDDEKAQKITKALVMLSRIKSDRIIATGNSDMDTFGLANPPMVITVFKKGQTQPGSSFHVGNITPDTLGRYIYVVQKKNVVIVPNYHIENIEKLIDLIEEARHTH